MTTVQVRKALGLINDDEEIKYIMCVDKPNNKKIIVYTENCDIEIPLKVIKEVKTF
jgi:hypothetical protein